MTKTRKYNKYHKISGGAKEPEEILAKITIIQDMIEIKGLNNKPIPNGYRYNTPPNLELYKISISTT